MNFTKLYLNFAGMRILMVCLGNICRSPLAEGILQQKIRQAGLKWTVDSAGTNGYHVGEAPHRLSQKVAKVKGIDISHQVSRQFLKSDLNNFDLIYAMADDVIDDIRHISGHSFNPEKIKLLMEEVFPGENMNIPDPWYGPEAGYLEVYDLIEKACEKIIANKTVNT